MSAIPSWTEQGLDALSESTCGYHPNQPRSAEPAALAAIAFAGAGRLSEARKLTAWLGSQQLKDGSVPPLEKIDAPGWATAQSIVAASAVSTNASPGLDINLACQWLLALRGETSNESAIIGHDTRILGWPWVAKTHAWQEPTAWAVLALESVGLGDHPRTREAVRLLVDRLLPTGGCNYGNTIVFHQRLRPHVEPTGITLVALAGKKIDDPRLARSISYVESALTADTTPVSLSYGLLGLAAHRRQPSGSGAWLESAYRVTTERGAAPLAIALLVLAAQGEDCLLLKASQRSMPQTS
jgi:hypothetical protein